MTDTSTQWDKACKALDDEFQLNANELPTIETAKALFLQLVGRREITQEAANAELARWLGTTPEALVGRTMESLIGPGRVAEREPRHAASSPFRKVRPDALEPAPAPAPAESTGNTSEVRGRRCSRAA